MIKELETSNGNSLTCNVNSTGPRTEPMQNITCNMCQEDTQDTSISMITSASNLTIALVVYVETFRGCLALNSCELSLENPLDHYYSK